MTGIEITQVTTPRERLEFIRMPWRLYKDDPHWVPPLIADQKEFLDPHRGVFFKFGQAALFMARRGGVPVGRISAHVNPLHEEKFHDGKGFFGFFETENDPEVAAALFGAAEGWLRSKGKRQSEGPLSFGIYDEVGILVDGFDTDPYVMCVHNPRYYGPLIEGAGYAKNVDWRGWWGEVKSYETLDPRLHRLKDRALSRSGITFRRVELKKLRSEAELVLGIFNVAWDANWGHVPLSRHEFERLVEALKIMVSPETSFIVEKDGKAIGMALTLYDGNVAVKKLNGHLFPFGFVSLLTQVKKTDRLRQMAMGVLKEYRGRGVEIAMYMSVAEAAYRMGAREMEMSLIVENNDPMNGTLAYLPVKPYKTWRIYGKGIA
jgi:GNAT superfamily N-acetyltransferase